jgi:hypothetical protein
MYDSQHQQTFNYSIGKEATIFGFGQIARALTVEHRKNLNIVG